MIAHAQFDESAIDCQDKPVGRIIDRIKCARAIINETVSTMSR